MSKKGTVKQYVSVVGDGNECRKCRVLMERRKRTKPPTRSPFFYSEWDYCPKCGHVQHYEEFKCSTWKEVESQEEQMSLL